MIRTLFLATGAICAIGGFAAAQSLPALPTQGGIAFTSASNGLGKAATAKERRNARGTFVLPAPKAQERRMSSPTALSSVTVSSSGAASWMHGDVQDAWALGYTGRGANITVIDDFNSGYRFNGNLSGSVESLTHGEWTRKEAAMIATGARVFSKDFTTNSTAVKLQRGFNAMNLSYGVFANDGLSSIRWGRQETSLIGFARDGKAVVVKAAGNDRVAVGAANSSGRVDYLNRDLIGKQSAIFVGALSDNGSVDKPASMASYSNFAGSNTTVQNQFLVVGVKGSETGLYGTSFAAPVVTGYAAIVRNKFSRATHTEVANQLLGTARQDTILNYNAAVHGRGEASLSRALAPVSIK
jgi:subtilisin family serine protease